MPVTYRGGGQTMATGCSEHSDEDMDDKAGDVLGESGLNVTDKYGKLRENIRIHGERQTSCAMPPHRFLLNSLETSSESEPDLEVNFIEADVCAESNSLHHLTGINHGRESGAHSGDGLVPISLGSMDAMVAASHIPLAVVRNGYVCNLFCADAHPYLEWDEPFSLTDYAHLRLDKRSVTSISQPCPPSGLNTNEMHGQNGTDTDDNSSIGSDVFDVFVNPVAHSDPDESDDVFSTNDCESVELSETDSDISRPRKSSLRDPKRPKTPPGTPSRKSVRFADALGLDLETVRNILEMDSCPTSPPPTSTLTLSELEASDQRTRSRTILRVCFEQPGGRPDFMNRLYEQNVCLENMVVSDMTVLGTIKVRNLAFQKEVRVRYTWDGWGSHANIMAMYVQGSCDGPTDRFTFGFSVPRRHTGSGDKVFFAIFYRVGDQEYWDNNHGNNYFLLIEEALLCGR